MSAISFVMYTCKNTQLAVYLQSLQFYDNKKCGVEVSTTHACFYCLVRAFVTNTHKKGYL